MIQKVARFLGLAVLTLAVFVAWTAPAPYSLPERRFVEPQQAFVPGVPTRTGHPNRLVVLVFDGLSPAAVRAAETPHLDRMAREGASTLDMRPSFPTLSLPNHFTLATGCHPARHGVVSNHFFDPDRGYYNAKGDADWLVECELLHEVAERQGVRSAVFGWVGNSSSARGHLATIAEPFRSPARRPGEQIDRVLDVLETRPEVGLVVAYSTAPDEAGHAFGPVAPETLDAVARVDTEIGRVFGAIDTLGLSETVTVIVTTDHGMVDAGPMLNVEGIVRRSGVHARVVGVGVVAHIHLDAGTDVDAARRALSEGASHYDVFDPASPPPGLALEPSARMGDLLIVPHEGYWLADQAHVPWYLRWASFASGDVIESDRFRGIHGYDANTVAGVRAVFFALGPGVPAQHTLEGLRSIDVHPTLAQLLAIEPGAPLDGRAHPALVRRDGSQP